MVSTPGEAQEVNLGSRTRWGWWENAQDSESHYGDKAWSMKHPRNVRRARARRSLGPGWAGKVAKGRPTLVYSWGRAPPDIPTYSNPWLRAAGARESKLSGQNEGEPLPPAMSFQLPLLTQLKVTPGKRKVLTKSNPLTQSKHWRTNQELRDMKLITGTGSNTQ